MEIERTKQLLGSGSYGHVYLTQDGKGACKIYGSIAHMLESDSLTSNLNEASIISRMRHPNIPLAYKAGWSSRLEYGILMELGDRALSDDRSCKFLQAPKHIADIMSALKFIHDLGYCHGDINPKNILIKGDRGLLTDFSIIHRLSNPIDPLLSVETFRSPDLWVRQYANKIVKIKPYLTLKFQRIIKNWEQHPRLINRFNYKGVDIFALGLCILTSILGVSTNNLHKHGHYGFITEVTMNEVCAIEEKLLNLTEWPLSAPDGMASMIAKMIVAYPGDRYQTMDEIFAHPLFNNISVKFGSFERISPGVLPKKLATKQLISGIVRISESLEHLVVMLEYLTIGFKYCHIMGLAPFTWSLINEYDEGELEKHKDIITEMINNVPNGQYVVDSEFYNLTGTVEVILYIDYVVRGGVRRDTKSFDYRSYIGHHEQNLLNALPGGVNLSSSHVKKGDPLLDWLTGWIFSSS